MLAVSPERAPFLGRIFEPFVVLTDSPVATPYPHCVRPGVMNSFPTKIFQTHQL